MNTETAKSAGKSESELDLPIWSVISFERCEASGLSYNDATEKVKELEQEQVAGLCIVTNEAAIRISSS